MVGACFILAAVFVDVLEDLVALEGGTCDEQCVLEVYLILFVVVVVCEFNEAEQREISRLVGIVLYNCTPYLVCCASGNVICNVRCDACIFSTDNRVSSTMATGALVGIQRLAYRLP